MSRPDAAADEVEFRLNGVAVAAVPVGTVIRTTGDAGQVSVTARVTVTARADGIFDTVLQIDVAQVRPADCAQGRCDLTGPLRSKC
jgi:hypothetical protein